MYALLVHVGSIHAGGSITLKAPHFLNAGLLQTEYGGKISIDITEQAMETTFARLSAPGGQIVHTAGTYFSSATYSAAGGSIEVFADTMSLVDAHLDAHSIVIGKHLIVGKHFDLEKQASHLYLSPTTKLEGHAPQLASAALWGEKQEFGLCASLGDSICTFASVGEFISPNLPGTGFGAVVQALSTGNVVITNPTDNAVAADSGAAYLYNGTTGALISVLTGSTATDSVSSGGIAVLTGNGNYVIISPFWQSGGSTVGAATWASGSTGVSGVVSSSNSLVGSLNGDAVSFGGVTTLTNGDYVVASRFWQSGLNIVGAATWGNGATGVTGLVSSSNSLVGSSPGDDVSSGGVAALTNGNYVVASPLWKSAGNTVGAATWGNGATGVTGLVSSSNSLVGSTATDDVSSGGVTALTNGNYVVGSPFWMSAGFTAGAATWGNGTTGVTGVVSGSNSLVGNVSDLVSVNGITALNNGNYVVSSPFWELVGSTVGAATWGNGTTGVVGLVSAANSLIGSTNGDEVSAGGIRALTNGNYVVASFTWGGFVGAATWGNGTTGVIGVVSSSNSLVGSTGGDNVSSTFASGNGITALTNGNYVVGSSNWQSSPGTNVGAATWGNGTTGVTGVVSSSNSIVGSQINDQVSRTGITPLTNGNYVVKSIFWQG